MTRGSSACEDTAGFALEPNQPAAARVNLLPHARRCSRSAGGPTTLNSAATDPTASAAQSSESVLIRMRQRPSPASSTLTHRPTRARTASAGASNSTSTSGAHRQFRDAPQLVLPISAAAEQGGDRQVG